VPDIAGPIRILLIDDHVIVRAGLRMLLENHDGMIVVGEAGTPAEGLRIAEREQPDIVLLDLDMGAESGLDFIPQCLTAVPPARVVILTGLRDAEAHRRAVHLGALGLVFKEKAAEVLIKAIQKVYKGEVWLDRALMATVLSERSHADERKPDAETKKISFLTEREREVVGLVCEGLKNKQIGDRLFISEATVRNHLTSILSKLGLSDRFELALFAYRHHLARPPG
jgi:two-component system, NarL family, nitrate/nitrite response regulator NarL